MKKYSIINNFKFVIKILNDKKAKVFTLIMIPIKILIPIITSLITSYIIYALTNDFTLTNIIITTCGLLLFQGIFNFLSNSGQEILKIQGETMRYKIMGLVFTKSFETDYQNMEKEDFQNQLKKIIQNIGDSDSAVSKVYTSLYGIIASILSIVVYGYILASLNPIIIVVIIGSAFAHMYLMKKRNIQEKNLRQAQVKPQRMLNYLWNYSKNYTIGKDIRIYGLSSFFGDKFDINIKETYNLIKNDQNDLLGIEFGVGVITLIRDFISYGYLVQMLITNNLNSADFVFYFSMISTFAIVVYGFSNQIKTIEDTSIQITEFREFIDVPDRLNRDKGVTIPKNDYSIEFKNLSFKYPSSEEYTIKSVNLKIKNGEKIAIVGLNGAGKTTLVKLLCGFYEITSGEILVGGVNINKFNIFEYYKTLCVVFQTTLILPMSIKDNITIKKERNLDLNSLVKEAGLDCSKFTDGMDTKLNKEVQEDAIDISGGEIQKLALAKAMYKDGKILILDEPTAALDPIAEREMYENYNEITKEKTSIFISHRLSSTKFCDRIILLEKGEIIEVGSHDELMQLNGKYKDLFDIQSHYYKEDVV